MKRIAALILVLTAGLFAMAQQPAKPPAPKIVYIRAGHLFDATGETVRDNVVIVVRDDRIQSVAAAPAVTIPAGAPVIDLSKATELPGLVDCHTHMGARADRYDAIYAFTDTRL